MITVIGSLNMDLVIQMADFPQQGETVLGQQFQTSPGGKGANQAIAAARLGSSVTMIGCVGDDRFGHTLRTVLEQEHIDTTSLLTTPESTGIANILVHQNDNRIIVVPGANYMLKPTHLDAVKDVIMQSQMVILQLEIPMETTAHAIKLCKEVNVPVLLNPAPAANFDMRWMDDITYLTPNEVECAQLFGNDFDQMLEKYPNKLIITLGRDGARYFDGEYPIHVPGYMTKAVDTTGAGDTFNGALAYALVEGQSLDEAVYFANIAASLAVEQVSAQGGMPTLSKVYARMAGFDE
ncbi:ribokinase [Lysinibacillus sphaericus]|uniref:Ribokinase n=1 Tax=Lysinibacillus sphaericus TaxID=1421 RepID=A0A2S5CYX4_LYSSH|nr:ribokinase [Lysinibacillus sphaericus]OEC00696.1 ribokinase [Lysinibacillus sphaericus]POZ56015.1 Ribokinase [Lysinibacillus sphaericus]